MSEFRGSVRISFQSFLYRLRDESPLAGSSRGKTTILSFAESKLNQINSRQTLSHIILHYDVSQRKNIHL